MTKMTFTSGEIMDIISALEVKENAAYLVDNDAQLSCYYLHLIQQFESVLNKLQERPGEQRVAELVLTA